MVAEKESDERLNRSKGIRGEKEPLREPLSIDSLILMRRQKNAPSICQAVLGKIQTTDLLGAGLLTILAEFGDCFPELAGTERIPTGQGDRQSELELFQLMLPFHRQGMAGIGAGSRPGSVATPLVSDRAGGWGWREGHGRFLSILTPLTEGGETQGDGSGDVFQRPILVLRLGTGGQEGGLLDRCRVLLKRICPQKLSTIP